MVRTLLIAITLLHLGSELMAAEEFDAMINDATRAFTKRKESPAVLYYGRIRLDSQGKIVSTVIKEGRVTDATSIVSGSFDETKKEWTPGDAIAGGAQADMFTTKGKVLQLQLRLADDGTTIERIIVTSTDAKLVEAAGEFDAIYKGHGRTNFGGRVSLSYVRIELDEDGQIINQFPLVVSSVSQETKVAQGKYNAETKKWEAGDDIEGGVWGETFADPGAKKIFVRITYRDDRRGIAQILLRGGGEKE